VALIIAVLVGGWFPARSLLTTGSPQPIGLPAHVGMLALPPGERGLGDYLRVPLATFRDPQLLNPDLLSSVWGSTYVTVWFDGHRYFLPRQGPAVSWLGATLRSRCCRRRPSPRGSRAAPDACGAARAPPTCRSCSSPPSRSRATPSTPGAIRGSWW
jgi:hypothetical protein